MAMGIETRRVINHPQEIKYQWQLAKLKTILVCTIIQLMRIVTRQIEKKIKVGLVIDFLRMKTVTIMYEIRIQMVRRKART